MGIIGVGAQGSRNLRSFLGIDEVQMVAVCDVDRRRLAKAALTVNGRYGNKDCASYTDFREVMARRDIDAVAIATQDHWHVPQAVRACKAGKDVYCQKPLSLTVKEARAAVVAARRHNRVFQVGTQNRSNAQARHGCELVRNGRLGKLRHIEVATWRTSAPCNLPAQSVPSHLDWDMWLGPAPWRPYHQKLHASRGWMPYRDHSGGGVTDFGAHFFDLAQWALGAENSGPAEITPRDPHKHNGRRVAYRYADGTVMYRRIGGNYIEFVGSEGRIRMDVCAWVRVKITPEELGREPIRAVGIQLYESKDHFRNFVDCIRTRGQPAADVEAGCRAATICHIGNIAQWMERPLKWNPEKELFVGDATANRWLDRARRAPWSI